MDRVSFARHRLHWRKQQRLIFCYVPVFLCILKFAVRFSRRLPVDEEALCDAIPARQTGGISLDPRQQPVATYLSMGWRPR